MEKEFTKKNLQTGDIIETRNGKFGVVILEKNCILYQAGGLDELDVFTEDMFVDGPERDADIIKVYSDPEGPIGFNKRFGIAPVFRRKNDKAAKMIMQNQHNKSAPPCLIQQAIQQQLFDIERMLLILETA